MVDCEMDTLIEAETGRERRRATPRRKRRTARVVRSVSEVYVVPDGMVDVALRELGARLVTDDSEPSQLRPAA
jgi:hypothetical protein